MSLVKGDGSIATIKIRMTMKNWGQNDSDAN